MNLSTDPKRLPEHSENTPITRNTRKSIKNAPKQAVWQVDFNSAQAVTQTFEPKHFTPSINPTCNQWFHFVGIHDEAMLTRMLEPFQIHPLVIEDILHPKQQPKIEQYDHYLFIVGRALSYQEQHLSTDQAYIIVGENFVLSFQNRPLGLFSSVRDHLQLDQSTLRAKGADFLAYTLLDCLVDDYFTVLAQFEKRVETVDRVLFDLSQEGVLQKIHALKHETTKFKRTLLPLTENLKQIVRGDFAVFTEETRLFVRDAYDHAIHLLDSLNSAREMVSSMTDLYLSFQSNHMNIQIRVLTVITMMILPLTLITGIYGMNFDYMPELHWKYGYFIVLALMVLISSLLCWIFYKKRWL